MCERTYSSDSVELSGSILCTGEPWLNKPPRTSPHFFPTVYFKNNYISETNHIAA